MERYSFFNAVMDSNGNYDREYLAEDFAAYFASFIGNGVYASPSANLKVTNAGGMDVRVFIGKAWINGYFYENTASKIFSLDILNQTAEYSRIDSIVLRLNLLDRVIETDVKKGTSAKNPSAPTLERNENIFELRLADIKVVGGRTEIKSQDITDCRFGSDCGVVSGVVNQIDTEELFSQYDAEFRAWFADVEATLSGDVAGNLYNQIAIERKRIDNMASLKDGSTSGDAELIDIRIGSNGTTYTSAGDAVRSQFGEVNERLDLLKNATPKEYNFIPITENSEDLEKNRTLSALGDMEMIGKSFSEAAKMVYADGFAIFRKELKKGDSIIFSNAVAIYPSSFCNYIYLAGKDGVVDMVYALNCFQEQKKYTLKEDGIVIFSFKTQGISGVGEYFFVKEASRTEPIVLDSNANYENDAEAGEATLKAIMEGKNVVVRVPNASGDNYVATYSPIYMYQLPNYQNEYLYLFYLKDEKQNLDLSALGVGTIQLPIYGQIKMKLSREYNQTPLM